MNTHDLFSFFIHYIGAGIVCLCISCKSLIGVVLILTCVLGVVVVASLLSCLIIALRLCHGAVVIIALGLSLGTKFTCVVTILVWHFCHRAVAIGVTHFFCWQVHLASFSSCHLLVLVLLSCPCCCDALMLILLYCWDCVCCRHCIGVAFLLFCCSRVDAIESLLLCALSLLRQSCVVVVLLLLCHCYHIINVACIFVIV